MMLQQRRPEQPRFQWSLEAEPLVPAVSQLPQQGGIQPAGGQPLQAQAGVRAGTRVDFQLSLRSLTVKVRQIAVQTDDSL